MSSPVNPKNWLRKLYDYENRRQYPTSDNLRPDNYTTYLLDYAIVNIQGKLIAYG